jgi:small-conductance mechanosensitive channel
MRKIFVGIYILLHCIAALWAQTADSTSLPKGYTIALYQDTIITIYSGIGSISAEQRQKAISDNIEMLYNRDDWNTENINIKENNFSYDIWYDDELIILSIFESDVPEGIKPKQYANLVRNRIVSSIDKQRQEHSTERIITKLLYLLAIIIGIGLLIRYTNKFFVVFQKWLQKHNTNTYLSRIKIFSPRKIIIAIIRMALVARWILVGFIVYLSLPLIFSIFPETRQFTDTLINWILSPAKKVLRSIFEFLPNLFTIVIVWFIINQLVKFVRYIANEVEAGRIVLSGFYPEWAQTTFSLVRFLLYVFLLIVIFPYLPGSNSPAFQGVSVFLGLILSLGSSSAITNIIAGLVITYMRPFKIGDRIKINDTLGDVLEKNLLNTRIRTSKNEEITIPNSAVLSGSVVNYSAKCAEEGVILHTTVTIGYDVPWKKVHESLIQAAKRCKLAEQSMAPFVLQTSLDDFYVAYQVNIYTKQANQMANVYSELHMNIQDVFNENGIEIMSPHYHAQRDGSQTTIPQNYLPADYEAPAFRVELKKNDNSN